MVLRNDKKLSFGGALQKQCSILIGEINEKN